MESRDRVVVVARKSGAVVLLLNVWIVVVVKVGPQRTSCYNMKNNMVEVQ